MDGPVGRPTGDASLINGADAAGGGGKTPSFGSPTPRCTPMDRDERNGIGMPTGADAGAGGGQPPGRPTAGGIAGIDGKRVGGGEERVARRGERKPGLRKGMR